MPASTGNDRERDFLRRHLEQKWLAGLFMLACFAGAGLVGWHWFHTPWDVRTAELGGLSSFSRLGGGRAAQLQAATADPWLPVLGIVLLAAGGLLGRVVAASHLARRLSVAAAVTLILLAAVHVAEELLLGAAVQTALIGHNLYAEVLALQGTAFVGYALLPIAGFVALLGGLTTFIRLSVWGTNRLPRRQRGAPGAAESASDRIPGPEGEDAHWCDSAHLPPGRTPGGLGICLSGGGIRSATFGLGAIQALQRHPPLTGEGTSELSRARYLTAVSGGAYAAGALLLATHPRDDPPKPSRPPDPRLSLDQVFMPGSPEFDHLRRHSSYIADSFREWAIAVLVVIRGAFLSMLFLGLVALAAGRWAGFLYYQIKRAGDLASPWQPVWGPVFATLAVAALALLLWLGSTRPGMPHRLSRGLAEAARMTSLAVAILVFLGAFIPVAARISMAIINATGGAGQGHGTPAGGAAKGGVLAASGIIITVAGLLLRRRSEVIRAARAQARTWRRRIGDIGGQVVHWLAVYLGLALVAAVYLVVFGYSASITSRTRPDSRLHIAWGTPHWTSPLTSFWVTVALTVFLLVVYLLVDETVMGLHPFYRRRLASAFAVRRVQCGRPDPEHPSGYKAIPYKWEERTSLTTHGNVPQRGQEQPPQVIFCAAAHCSDPEQAPPGRHVLPFTFSHDSVGGPEIGWCPTRDLSERTSSRLKADLTVQTAMAVSGAAFASAAGTYRRPADVVLALMNARLGTWVANPGRMWLADGGSQHWWRARPPRIRRLAYLLREIMGWYPKEIPLLFVTDGGLYENLGLLELLRHRCTEIYCFDATSDTGAFAASLAQSIALAYDELGITVTPAEPVQADPRADGKGVDARDLRGRLSQTPVITAEVKYPPQETSGETVRGHLVIGRATMDPMTPWEIRRYAAANTLFPHDATGDQWFTDRKFNAYTGLGRHVGDLAIDAMKAQRQPADGQAPAPPAFTRTAGERRPVSAEIRDGAGSTCGASGTATLDPGPPATV